MDDRISDIVKLTKDKKGLYIIIAKHGTGIVKKYQDTGAFLAMAAQMELSDCIPFPGYSVHEALFPKKDFPSVLVISEADHNPFVSKQLIQEYTDKSSVVMVVYDDEGLPNLDFSWLGQSYYDRAMKFDLR